MDTEKYAEQIMTFTPQERVTAALLRQGKCNKLIAREMDVGHHTVKVHVMHIMQKLQCANRTQAALKLWGVI